MTLVVTLLQCEVVIFALTSFTYSRRALTCDIAPATVSDPRLPLKTKASGKEA